MPGTGVSLKWSRGLLQEGGPELALEGRRGFTETGSSVGPVGWGARSRSKLPAGAPLLWAASESPPSLCPSSSAPAVSLGGSGDPPAHPPAAGSPFSLKNSPDLSPQTAFAASTQCQADVEGLLRLRSTHSAFQRRTRTLAVDGTCPRPRSPGPCAALPTLSLDQLKLVRAPPTSSASSHPHPAKPGL